MPVYDVTDPKTGQTLSLQGDSPPTEQELEEVFSEIERRSKPKMGLGDLYLSQAEFEQQDIKPIQLPIYGEPGTYTRGASKALSKLVESSTTPEGIALGTALMIPVVGPALATAMGAAAVKEAAQIAGEAAGRGGDKEAAGEAAVLAALGGVGVALPLAHVGQTSVRPGLVAKAGEAIGKRVAPIAGELEKLSQPIPDRDVAPQAAGELSKYDQERLFFGPERAREAAEVAAFESTKTPAETLKTEAPLTAAELAKDVPKAKVELQAAITPEPAIKLSQEQLAERLVPWGKTAVMDPEKAYAQGPEAYAQQQEVFKALSNAFSVREALDMTAGKKPYPSLEDFIRRTDTYYTSEGYKLQQSMSETASALGKKPKFPSLNDFASPKQFYEAMLDASGRVKASGAALEAALVRAPKREAPPREPTPTPEPPQTPPEAKAPEPTPPAKVEAPEAKEPPRRKNYLEIQREREAILAERAKQVETEEAQRYSKQEQDAQPVIDVLRQVSGEKHPVTGIATDRGGNIWSEAVDGKFTQDQLNAARSWLVRNGTTDTRLIRAIEGAAPKPEAKPAAETAPVAAAAKVEQQVKSVAKTEGQRSAKEVKSELVQRLEQAIKDAPTAQEVGYEAKKITIDIPGDGTFTIFNTKEALEGILKRAKRISTESVSAKATFPKGAVQSSEKALRKMEKAKEEQRVRGLGDLKSKARVQMHDALNKSPEEGIVGHTRPEEDPAIDGGTLFKEYRLRKTTPQEQADFWKSDRREIRWIGEMRVVRFDPTKGRTENEWGYTSSGKTYADAMRQMVGDAMPANAVFQNEGAQAWHDLEYETGKFAFLSKEPKPPETPPTGTKTPSQNEPPAPGEIVGMGGAVPSEFEPGGAAAIDIYGIAQRVREARAKAGQVAPVEPGVGMSPIDSVERGQQLLSRGVDPEKALSDFERSGRFSADDIAVTRAHGEQLTKAAERTAEKFGTESQQYLNAWTKLSEWDRRTKPMNTEWQKMGVAQQGATDIDTGSYTSLQRAFGETFTEKQSATAKRYVEATKKAEAEAATAKADLAKALADLEKSQAAKPRFSDYVLGVAEKWVNQWGQEAAKARKALAGKFLSPSPEDLLNLAKIARYDIAQIGLDFAKWSDKMVQEFGPKVQPYLAEAWRKGQELIDAMAATIKSPTTRKQVKSAVTKAPDPVRKLWRQAKDYIDKGETDPETVFSKLSVDSGMPRDQVREMLTKPKSVKRISDEMYRKMADRRRVVNSAKAWLENEKLAGWEKFIRLVPRIFFIDKIAGHGAVGMITHAGLNMFDPKAWKAYFPSFFRQIPLAFNKAYHERMMLDLTKDPNFITARRGGLVNDPWRYADDYQNIAMKKFFGRFSRLIGGEGFDSLKLFRQARFNQEWNALPESVKTPEMANLLSTWINHATGVVKGRLGGEMASTWLFAPKLEASRWAWTFGDTFRTMKTRINWQRASAEERAMAMIDFKQKVRIAGTYLGMLALNEGILQMVNSDQHVNFSDPTRADFLSFKVAGHKVGVIGPMIGIFRLLGGIVKHAVTSQHEMRPGEKVSGRAAEIYRDIGSYARGKLSPFGGQIANITFQSDYSERPVPWSSDRPKRYLERQGRGQYTYPEYFLQELTPIPASEVVREIWASQGMDETAIQKGMKALAVGAVAVTGARISKDYSTEHPYAR